MITILNVIRIIYSHIIVNKYINIQIENSKIEKIISTHNTSILDNSEIVMWIKYMKPKYSNWNEYEMYREILYHKKMYNHNWFINRTEYADFEEVQTIKTYFRRIIGNCIY